MNGKKPWTDELRDKLSQYDAKNVPQGLWDDIVNALDTNKGRMLPWRGIACAAAVLVALCGVGILWYGSDTDGNMKKPLSARMYKKSATNEPASEESTIEQEAENVVAAKSLSRTLLVMAAQNEGDSGGQEEQVKSVPNAEDKSDENKKHETETAKSIVVRKNSNGGSLLAENRDKADRKKQASNSTNHGMSVSLYASNLPSSLERKGDVQPVYMLMSDVSGVSPTVYPLRAVAYSNRNEPTKINVKHHHPVSIGVGVRYFFNRHWAVESGVSYMILESETKSGTDHSYAYTDEKVRYIGVPVSVGYQWIGTKRLSVYSSVGVQADFGISGKQESQYVVDEQPISEITTNSIHNIPVQWSLSAATGVQYNIVKRFGLYAEPGVTYYIDNGSSLQSSYNDKKLPLIFNLKVGLRYDFGK